MRRSRPDRSTSLERGATFIEVLVTALLLALVTAGLLPLLTAGQQGYDDARRRQEMTGNARVALDKLLREIRAAESFRALGAGLVRLMLFWGDGTGDMPTVEYVLNTSTSNLEYRWKDNWDYRQPITVTAADAVTSGYAVALTFNHAALVSAGKSLASGDDLRIRYWTGTKMVELDRMLDPTSGWNLTSTKIWFRLQAAIAANGSSTNTYLFYGNPAAGSPPANGDNIFLDYEDGSTLDGWTRRDTLPGTYSATATDGFRFQDTLDRGFRELTKAVSHSNVEIFWGFWVISGSSGDSRMPGVTARRSNTGAGYWVTPGFGGNSNLAIHRPGTWSDDRDIASVNSSVTAGTNYYGRFYLVGSSIRAKIWQTAAAEPAGWQVTVTDTTSASGNHYGLVNGDREPLDHRQRTVILRPRVANEPALTLGAEAAGTRTDPLVALAGPFRSMTVTCYDAAGSAIACAPTSAVRSVQVALVVMDPTGLIPDITVTGRASRYSP